jgi:hypothetical protein
MSKRPAHNMKFYWQEDEIIGHRTEVTAGEIVTLTADTESAVIEVENVDIFTVGDMIRIEDSGVLAYVSDVEDTEANHIKIIPGFDEDATATDIAGGEVLQKVGSADAEGAGVRDSNRRQIAEKYNYLQIFKTNFSMTDIQMATKTYGDQSDWSWLRTKKGIEHNEQIERALLFGGRAKSTNSTIGDHPTYTTNGLFESIQTNIETLGSSTALTESSWNNFLKDKAFKHGSKKKLLIASPTLASQISQFAKDNGTVNMNSGANQKYGVHVDQYVGNLGHRLDVIVHDFLEGPTYGQSGVVVDMDSVNLRYLEGNGQSFDTKLLVDVKKDGVHRQIDEYYSVLGLELKQEERHAVIHNTLDNS